MSAPEMVWHPDAAELRELMEAVTEGREAIITLCNGTVIDVQPGECVDYDDDDETAAPGEQPESGQ